jgi:hypothetical protein
MLVRNGSLTAERSKGRKGLIQSCMQLGFLRRFAPPDRVGDLVPHNPSPTPSVMPLACAAGDGWDQQDFVSVLERVLVSAEEADVFFVHVHIQEAANFS